ncbi:extracellular solute-binding protein [Clostridium sp. MCC353]|uniref:extracellular solute-binding protein n=1 Tax=Clostridium sp. MCC353 TaxID=2592646 RepID=UPI001C034F56|nr:extracellular solute-binding protein [Clostridium sp. MCC353]MBT9776744.1 extracellular solute-binding protein [Clostridium sp. MCC353]
MKKTRRITSVILSTCMALSMTACGSKTQQEPSGQSQTAAAQEVTEITFWHSMDTSYGEILNAQIDKFNETTGKEKKIKVVPVFQNYPGTDALTAAMSSDDTANMPDVIQLYSESVSLVRDYERLVWAEDMINKGNSSVAKTDIIPNVRKSFEIDGRLIGMPYNIACYLLYYNQNQLKEAGYAEPPKTVQEMAEMLPVLVEKTDADFGLNVRINMNELINFIGTQGSSGTLFGNNDNGHSGYMTELECIQNGSLKAFIEEWGKVIDSGCYKAVRDSINEEFAAGLHSMVIMSSSRLKTIENLVGDGFEWGVSAVPVINAGDAAGSYPTGSGLFVLNRDNEEKVNGAWEFVQYMSSPEIQAQWVETTGYVPVNMKAFETDIFKNAVADNPKQSVPYEVLVNTPEKVTSPFVPNYKEIDTLIKDTMISYANKELDADGTYAAVAEGVKKIFEDYYRANPVK